MSLAPDICIKVEADLSKITTEDDTGVYTADNLTGYGAPNGERADYAAVLVVEYQPYNGDVELLTNLNDFVDFSISHTNSYQTKFEVEYRTDGWYIFNYILVPTTIAVSEGNIFYSTINEKLMQYDESLSTVDVFDYTKLKNSQLYNLVEVHKLITGKLSTLLNTKSREFSQDLSKDCDYTNTLLNSVVLREALRATHSQFIISRYEAQKLTEKLLKDYKI